MDHETTIPREVLEQVVERYNDLLALKSQQHAIMAQMIRGCVTAIDRKATGWPWPTAQQKAEVEHDRERAMLHLQWLATQLELDAGVDLVSPAATIISQ